MLRRRRPKDAGSLLFVAGVTGGYHNETSRVEDGLEPFLILRIQALRLDRIFWVGSSWSLRLSSFFSRKFP